MPFTVTMPKLSPTMESGVIDKWLKNEGDRVESGELLLEVSTDKATIEQEALDEGYLRKILVGAGAEARVNQAIAVFTETVDESIDDYEPEGISVTEAPAPPEVASESSEDTGGDEEVATKSVSPATSGLAQPAFAPAEPLEGYTYKTPRQAAEERVKASPLARKLARDKGLDLHTVHGSGPGGRVMSRDLEGAQAAADVAFGSNKVPQIPPGTYEEESLTPMRRVIAKRLQESKTFIPHFYVRQSIDAEPMVGARQQLIEGGVKVTYNDFVVRACALALRKHPIVNSAFNSVNNTIARFKTIDVCVAVTVDGGLITPIIRHTDFKNLGEISLEVRTLAKRAKAGKLEPEEYQGGSFTVSNLGMFGIDDFVAVINPPQAAILAVGGVLDVPVVRDGELRAGKVMNLVLSSDHRVVDGVEAAKFLQTVRHFLENPALLLL